MVKHQYGFKKQDECYTKVYAIYPILKYLKPNSTIWCPFDLVESNYVKVLQLEGFNVIHSHITEGLDFFDYEPEQYDYIISNPPYSLKEPILDRLFNLNKPFAMLINEAGLFDSKKRYELFKNNPFELMIFDKRIDYIRSAEEKSGVPFKSIYCCSRILPEKIIFEELGEKTKC
jgi:hypothetical protein